MDKCNLKYYCCPDCRGSLYELSENGKILSNRVSEAITCKQCNKIYPIINGIPRFVTENNYCQAFGFQWNRHRRVQIDKYNGYNFSRDRFYEVTKWSEHLDGECVLEVGSGAGRFTQVLLDTGDT